MAHIPSEQLLRLVIQPKKPVRYAVTSPSCLNNVAFANDLIPGSASRSTLKVVQITREMTCVASVTHELEAMRICELVEGKVRFSES
jgi:hypothetical protein